MPSFWVGYVRNAHQDRKFVIIPIEKQNWEKGQAFLPYAWTYTLLAIDAPTPEDARAKYLQVVSSSNQNAPS